MTRSAYKNAGIVSLDIQTAARHWEPGYTFNYSVSPTRRIRLYKRTPFTLGKIANKYCMTPQFYIYHGNLRWDQSRPQDGRHRYPKELLDYRPIEGRRPGRSL